MWIKITDIHKHYGKIKANNGISFSVQEGTIHGIIGENGAGKSTLMKVLAGFTERTSGQIFINGSQAHYKTPAEASALGIGMLYQDPLDFPQLTVLDNFMLGRTKGIKTQAGKQKKIFLEIIKSLSFNLNGDSPVKNLTIGERQQLEITRLLSLGIELLILDEPTTGLSSIQKEILFSGLKKIATQGKSIILVSHKLEDIQNLCDKITILRKGRITGEMLAPFSPDQILSLMFGTRPPCPSRIGLKAGKPLIAFNRVSALGGRTGLKDCSVIIRQKEIIGLAGLEGSGQGVFLRTAAGLKAIHKGSLTPAPKSVGAAFLPASRLEEGLIPGFTIAEHLALLNKEKSFFISKAKTKKSAETLIDRFNIKGRPDSTAESLSGGNQQRLLLSLLPSSPGVLLLEKPTRGLDIESAHWVWQHLQQYCTRSKTTIVFSSSELDEILQVADRIFIFFDGKIIKDTPTTEIDIQTLGRAIAGMNQI